MKVLISKKRIAERIKTLADEVKADYRNEVPIFIGILKGSFIFMADFVREYGLDCEIDFMAVASYGSGKSATGVIKLVKDINADIRKRHVLIVEDIVDTGLTSNYIRQYLALRQPKSIEFIALLDKYKARKIDINIKYTGFKIPTKFVVGYGLDYAERYRQLPFVAVSDD